MNFIPFEALLTADPGSNISLRHAPYTVRRQEIQYAWSYSVLQQQYRLTTTGARYLLAFAPGFAGHERGLAPLLSDESEWETAGHWGARSFTGAQADTRRFFEHASRYRVLHLSTHAFAGEPTRIELYDQALLLPDIYALSLHADLVVLSACQTGLGREQRGEGVMSLARAFAQAGAACVVSGLWSVNDRSTARVLSDFYRLIGEGRSICASLRQAKLEYLNDPEVGAAAQSPYFWAGLAVVGADRSVERNEASLLTAGLLLGGGIVTFIFILWQIFGRRRHFPSKNGPKPAKTK
jgi:CHAT domain-containing protein